MIRLRPMNRDDYDAVMALMQGVPGICLRTVDSRESVESYLRRNLGLSQVALDGDAVVGCCFASHDGRRGHLYHLTVAPPHRRQGIGRELVQRCLDGLCREGIVKTDIIVMKDNDDGRRFWEGLGWEARTDGLRYSLNSSDDPNA